MAIQSKNVPMDAEAIVQRSVQKNEPEWIMSLRKQGLSLASSLELPILEKTKLDRWNSSEFGMYQAPKPIASLQELSHESELLANSEQILVQVDSGNVYRKLSDALSSKGVIFTDLESALKTHSELLKKYFMQAVHVDEHRLTAIHAALWSGGVFIYVPSGVHVEVPLQALFVATNAHASFSPHVVIVAEANSSVTYIENFVSRIDQGNIAHNGIVEVFVKHGAKVQVASIHNLQTAVTDYTYRRAIVEQDGSIEWILGELNQGNAVSDTTSILQGNGSSSLTKAICVGTEDQKLNLTSRVVHFGKHSTSDMLTRAVMRDQSTAIINGITKIEKGATGTNGQQTEKVLMLSPSARGDANPILLIDEDDVKAGHAASVGQVNPDLIYYLMSRGISKENAERLIIYGFLAPIVSEIPLKNIQEQLQRLVERKLGQ